MTTATAPKTIRDYEIEKIPPEILARIRKMLSVAEIRAGEDVTAREGEIANALTMAQRMMTELNLSMGDITALSDEAKREEDQAKQPIYKRAKVADSSIELQWKLDMAYAICEANFCDLLHNRTHFWVIGRPHNVAMVYSLFETIFPQVDRLAKYASGHRKKTGDPMRDHDIMFIPTPTYRLSYCLGVSSFLRKRLTANRNTDAVEMHGTTALVLDTKAANRRYMEETWPDIFKSKRRSRGSRGNQTNTDAWGHGYSEGGKVDTSVDARRVTGKVTPALGNGR